MFKTSLLFFNGMIGGREQNMFTQQSKGGSRHIHPASRVDKTWANEWSNLISIPHTKYIHWSKNIYLTVTPFIAKSQKKNLSTIINHSTKYEHEGITLNCVKTEAPLQKLQTSYIQNFQVYTSIYNLIFFFLEKQSLNHSTSIVLGTCNAHL